MHRWYVHDWNTLDHKIRSSGGSHLLNDAAIQGIGLDHRLEGRQRDFAALGPHAGPLHGDLPAPEDDLAGHGARTRGVAVGVICIPQAAQRRAVLLA